MSTLDRFCPACGTKLENISQRSGGMCGGRLNYLCPQCKRVWEEDQTGIIARPTNLTEITRRS